MSLLLVVIGHSHAPYPAPIDHWIGPITESIIKDSYANDGT